MLPRRALPQAVLGATKHQPIARHHTRDAPSSRLAPGQIGRNKRHRIYVLDHLAVAVGRRKREAVGQVPDLAHRAVAQQHFDNVKAHFHARLFEKLEVIEPWAM